MLMLTLITNLSLTDNRYPAVEPSAILSINSGKDVCVLACRQRTSKACGQFVSCRVDSMRHAVLKGFIDTAMTLQGVPESLAVSLDGALALYGLTDVQVLQALYAAYIWSR